jgi:hypothetical protein
MRRWPRAAKTVAEMLDEAMGGQGGSRSYPNALDVAQAPLFGPWD